MFSACPLHGKYSKFVRFFSLVKHEKMHTLDVGGRYGKEIDVRAVYSQNGRCMGLTFDKWVLV
jgi:hypothetical protein